MSMPPTCANTKNRKQQHEEQKQHAQEPENQVTQRTQLQLHKWQQCEAAGSQCIQVYKVILIAMFGVHGS